MAGRRRARAGEYAQRVNAAAALLQGRSPAETARAVAAGHGLSERQARRYLRAAERAPAGLVVPEQCAVFTVRLPVSLIARLRSFARSQGQTLSATVAEAVQSYLDRSHERRGGKAG